MNQKRINVCIVFGGKSSEHEVSINSAKSIFEAIDKEKYDVSLLGVTKTGSMSFIDHTALHNLQQLELLPAPGDKLQWLSTLNEVSTSSSKPKHIDIFFPVIHGTNGEDGTLQGFLEMLGVPYVGANVLGSAIGMDKDVTKRLLNHAGIQTARFLTIRKADWRKNPSADGLIEHFINTVGFPIFIKPANMGSSIGINKAESASELLQGIEEAFHYDNKILLEEGISGAEIEVAILGTSKPIASVPGKVLPNHEFYTYEDKYFENGADFEIPAKLLNEKSKEIQNLGIKAFTVLECSGLARVDMFLKDDGTLLINEINTLPGFTKTSMYPKLWKASGISYTKLIDMIIKLTLEGQNNA